MTATVPAGWYSDPAQRHQFRYWDGTQWTAHVSTGGVTSVDPAGSGPAPQGTATAAGQPGGDLPATMAVPAAAAPGGPATGGFSPAGAGGGGFVPPGGAAGGLAAGQVTPVLPGAGMAPGSPLMPGSPVVPGAPAGPGVPAGGRKRRRWLVAVLATVVALGLVTGLLIWAPWVPPPVLRPAGLAAGSATTSSVSFRWSGPATGPLPDKYLILHNGQVIGSVRGTVTSYQISGLAPASDFAYQVAAERGGKRSRPSARLLLTTVTPPVSAARLDGAWTVTLKILQGRDTLSGHPPKIWTEGWTTSPKCPSGPCSVKLTGTLNGHPFKANLKRSGAQYRGTTHAGVIPCGGSGGVSIPSTSTMIFKIKVSDAGVTGSAWTASSWKGSLVVNSPYVSSGNYFCNASTLVFAMSATP